MADKDLPDLGKFQGGFTQDEDHPEARVWAALQEGPPEDSGDLLTGYVAICEWMDPDGNKYITRLDSGLVPWQREGLLRYVLRWESEDEEDPD